jgi:hypothetical protein
MNSAMQPFAPKLGWWLAALTAVGLGAAAARAENSPVDRPRASVSNAAPAEILIPKSVFVIPSNSQEGTDPFFPKAVPRIQPAPKDPRPTGAAELHLKGFSGTPQHRLAIISNYTLAEGEEGDLNLGTTRVHLRCVEIKADSVVIEVSGERRELRLRQGL